VELARLLSVCDSVWQAFRELLAQEFRYSTGHLTAVLHTCLFAPSLLTFWFVNGLLDFSTAITIGAVGTVAGLQIRLLAYLLLLPTFVLVRATLHLLHPRHRKQVLAGSCPETRFVSLDWFSLGILTTGVPLAIQNIGPWVSMQLTFLGGIFVVPRLVRPARRGPIKLATVGLGSGLFVFANYGDLLPVLPRPAPILGPIATATLSDGATASLMAVVNSLLLGPVVVGAFGVAMNHILTRPELTDIPLLSYALPRRDPDTVVATSAGFGTLFYLLVVAAVTGQWILLP
jgi:hypothetical protein